MGLFKTVLEALGLRSKPLPPPRSGRAGMGQLLSKMGAEFSSEVCGICKQTFAMPSVHPRVLGAADRTPEVAIEVGGFCTNCHAPRCPGHSQFVLVPEDGLPFWYVACGVCGSVYRS